MLLFTRIHTLVTSNMLRQYAGLEEVANRKTTGTKAEIREKLREPMLIDESRPLLPHWWKIDRFRI